MHQHSECIEEKECAVLIHVCDWHPTASATPSGTLTGILSALLK